MHTACAVHVQGRRGWEGRWGCKLHANVHHSSCQVRQQACQPSASSSCHSFSFTLLRPHSPICTQLSQGRCAGRCTAALTYPTNMCVSVHT